MDRRIEILSPAGSYESLKAAIAAGADAVYIGGTRFGARAYADNLEEDMMLEAIDYVHLHGKKIYLTVNTLLKEQECANELYEYLLPYYKQGIDAVIVQDVGVLARIKEQFPDLPIHASTQMTITNVLGAKFMEKLGVERIVTAREMQLEEIREIAEQTNLEIESFVHGALCYCYSGQCLYSSMLGGRSGNRGQCAQPCRLPYQVNGHKETQYVMSLKDMCTLEYIPELVEAGICSFKIEGRMKKPEYVGLVTAMYRKYLDLYLKSGKQGYSVESKDREMLLDIYNRGGSHGGYYYNKNGRDMLSLKRPNHAGVPALKVMQQKEKSITTKALVDMHKGDVIELPNYNENYTLADDFKVGQTVRFITHKPQNLRQGEILNRTRNERLLAEVREGIVDKKIKEKMNGELLLSTERPTKLVLSCQDIKIEVIGECAQQALNQPIAKERIYKQMTKTGNTAFEFEHLQIEMQNNLFVPMQSLNELRRRGIETLEEAILSRYRRVGTPKVLCEEKPLGIEREHIPLYTYVEQMEQWETVVDSEMVKRIYIDCNAVSHVWKNSDILALIEHTHRKGKEIYFGMPHVFRSKTVELYENNYKFLFGADWDGVLIRNYESLEFLRAHQYTKNIVTDYNLYQFNQSAKAFWKKQNIESTTMPLELNNRELADVGAEFSELIVYGYYPMMISAQCLKKTTEGCDCQKGLNVLKDRYRKEFAVKNLCDYCYNIIYNTAPTVLASQKKEILDLQPRALRMHFTIEDKETTKNMIRFYEEVFCHGTDRCEPDMEFTRGHFKRGIK